MKNRSSRNGKVFILFLVIVIALIGIGAAYYVSSNGFKKEPTPEEKAQLEEQHAEEVKDALYGFNSYLEQPEIDYEVYEVPPAVKSIYLTAYSAATSKKVNEVIELCNTTELNSVVIDIKTDDGAITLKTGNKNVSDTGLEDRYQIPNLENTVKKLKENDIYPIARIVCFKDPLLANARPEYAIKNKDGSLWKYKGINWLNPYVKDTWKYIIDVAEAAAKAGFEEIQFDYIRFEATVRLKNADLGPMAETKSRQQIILEFLDYANERLDPLGVKLSADVFGIIITGKSDAERIGQDYIGMAERLDVICPMIYPSHYGDGYFGVKHPDLEPYLIIKGALDASNKLYAEHTDKKLAKVRPWLQSFSAPWLGAGKYMPYGANEIREQVKATYDTGWEEWILWNSSNRYPNDAFLKNK